MSTLAPSDSSGEWNWVAVLDEVQEGDVIGRGVGDLDIAIYNVSGVFYATDNVCTHALARLSDGLLDGYQIECPLHGGKFDVRTGKGLCEPIKRDLKVYPVRLVGEEIQVRLGAKEP